MYRTTPQHWMAWLPRPVAPWLGIPALGNQPDQSGLPPEGSFLWTLGLFTTQKGRKTQVEGPHVFTSHITPRSPGWRRHCVGSHRRQKPTATRHNFDGVRPPNEVVNHPLARRKSSPFLSHKLRDLAFQRPPWPPDLPPPKCVHAFSSPQTFSSFT